MLCLFVETLARQQHSAPNAWWIGQIVKYLFRLKPWVINEINKVKEAINFTHPIVG